MCFNILYNLNLKNKNKNKKKKKKRYKNNKVGSVNNEETFPHIAMCCTLGFLCVAF